jgi:S1-C subfamily serine protease
MAFLDKSGKKLGGASAFLSNGMVLTNHHVFLGHRKAAQVGIRRDDMPAGEYRAFASDDFAARLVTGSQEQSYDYAVLRLPEVIHPDDHQFTLERPGPRRIGDTIALLGFPLEHDNLTCHQGVISSFYESGLAKIIQVDASVNAGNSGGPLIDPETGAAIGVVTRKATGLSRLFKELRNSIQQNIQVLQAASSAGAMIIAGVNPVEAIIVSQHQMEATLTEIERQANVGIGYAVSVEHLLAENCMQSAT